jgi:hypothetical protein
MGDEAVAPLADRIHAHAEASTNRFVAGLPLTRQDDARPLGQRRRQASRTRDRQLCAFLVVDR